MSITAKTTFNGTELDDIPVLNPGDSFGKIWLLELGGCYSPLFVIVEADSVSDAIDELAENEEYGQQIIVADEDLEDYSVDDRHYSGSGQVLDLDHLMVQGNESADQPFRCRYFGDGLPEEGVLPTEFHAYRQEQEDR